MTNMFTVKRNYNDVELARMNEKNQTFSVRIKELAPHPKTVKSILELAMIASAILTLALL